MPTLEQQRAKFALSKVQSVQANKDKYLTELRKLPARLHTSGLGQSVAFYISAGSGSPEATICGWLADWLRERAVYNTHASGLIGAITSDTTQDKYRAASVEARALAVWLKRFAEAFLESAAHAAPGAALVVESKSKTQGEQP